MCVCSFIRCHLLTVFDNNPNSPNSPYYQVDNSDNIRESVIAILAHRFVYELAFLIKTINPIAANAMPPITRYFLLFVSALRVIVKFSSPS